MLFNSLTFLVFFLVVMLVHRLPLPWAARKLNLLLASYLFYAAWNPPFVVLLWISTLTDWFAGRGIAAAGSPGRRRALLLLSLGVNLGLLGYFKYASFVLENFVWWVQSLGFEYEPPELDIILPLGISFYTFQTLSYTISIYRRQARPARSFLDYALFVTFFPQLVAGPIVRASNFLPQCVTPKRADADQLGWGLALLVIGLFEKVILADTLLAPTADRVYAAPAEAGLLDAWMGTLAFSAQIFFDFAGYSSCAIGAALCLGFVLPENFRCPYAAVGFSDFWRRWHISLSTWLRDFLYIPLGGNRIGVSRTYVNLMLTMLIGGLWHGASWHFVIWGGLHGVYLVVERFARGLLTGFGTRLAGLLRVPLWLGTFLVVTLTWTFFRAPDTASALGLVRVMFGGFPGQLLQPLQCASIGVIILGTLVFQWRLRDTDLRATVEALPLWLRGTGLALLILCLLLAPGDERAFIYFQF